MVALAVAIIFMGSLDFNNSSVFDPYWSVAPPLMVLFYVLAIALELPDYAGQFSLTDNIVSLTSQPAISNLAYFPRLIILFILTLIYSIRLTWNFLRGWPGLKHEDWRYVDFRKSTGKAYWVVSFFGIHLFPAVMVFGGTLSIWVVVVHGMKPMGFIDILAILVTGFAILLEAFSDRQMRRFLKEEGSSGKTMDQGLWGVSRHPNYLGEISFWWGLYLFALAANPAFWWVLVGPAAITLMFVFASIPMIEKRMMARRPDYAAYRKKVAMLIPFATSLPR
jgi:steroid 5-alpha reductase family enzyme